MSRSSRDQRSPARRAQAGSGGGDALPVGGFCPPCAICGYCGQGDQVLHHLTHGLAVWLCDAHRSDGFLCRRSGREFVERLAAVWVASGVLTVRKREALAAHLRRIEAAGMQRNRPGSYSWPVLRREAERRFAAGEAPAEVISELRLTYRDGPAMVPSVRTMRRWFTQARWLASPAHNRRHHERPAPRRRSQSQWQPFLDYLLTRVAYPAQPNPNYRRDGP